jgi:hypothetical protein
MPFLYEFRRANLVRIGPTGEVLFSLAASLLCPTREKRVSRLIGNFDTTAKAGGWQGVRRRIEKKG